MNARRLRLLALLPPLLALAACATTAKASRHFVPATDEDEREALAAWTAVRDRAAALAPSRLLYDAKLSAGGVASVPGTLAVTYDGSTVVTASLTGPFGSRIAEYAGGTVTGEDRKAFVVDPEALRAVLAGTWNGASPVVEGRDGAECQLAWKGSDATRVVAILDLEHRNVVSMELSGRAGNLTVAYSGSPDPWPGRIALRDEKTGRSLTLKLVAVEPTGAGGSHNQ